MQEIEPKDERVLSPPKLPDADRRGIVAQLERILASPVFAASSQSEKLLRHIVMTTLDGPDDELRERAIGVAVFGRSQGYDAHEDPIVRVRANDVRKRLARYYQGPSTQEEIHFEVPLGSYRVNFVPAPSPFPSAATEPEAVAVDVPVRAPSSRTAWRWRVVVPGVLSLLVVSAIVIRLWPEPRAVDLFWKPIVDANQTVFICGGHPVLFRLSQEFEHRLRRRGPAAFFDGQVDPPLLNPGQKLEGRDLIAMRNQYTGLGSARTIAEVAACLKSAKRTYQIRFGNDISYADLRNAPSVLVGVFSNRWTLELTSEQRFVFSDERTTGAVLDRQTGKRWALTDLHEDGTTRDDYCVVSRFRNPRSGQPIVMIAGVTQYGTGVAGEFVTSPELMTQAFANAPSGWYRQRVSVVLHTRVIGGTPETPEVVATHFW